VDVNRIIEELEELVAHGSIIPWFGRRCIDEDQFLKLIEELKRALPEEIAQAAALLQTRDRVLAEASQQARDIVEEAHRHRDEALEAAKRQCERMLSREEIVKKAEQRAQEIIDEAEREAAMIRSDAERYAYNVLDRLDTFVSAISQRILESKRSWGEPLGLETQTTADRGDGQTPPA